MEIRTSSKLDTLLLMALLWMFADKMKAEDTIIVVKGRTAILPVSSKFISDLSTMTVTWNFFSSKTNQVNSVMSYTFGQQSDGDPQFSNRVGFVHKMPSTNVSIFINDTIEEDSGRYTCNIIVPGKKPDVLSVVLNVVVPPSIPDCTVSGEPVLGGFVTLNCRSKSGKPVPTYHWQKTSPTSQIFIPTMEDSVKGTLLLTNLTKEMSGKYVCDASNTAGTESCYINLEVSAPVSAGVIAGAVVSALLLLLAALIFLGLYLKRPRDAEEEMANDIKEDAQAPKRASWSKSGPGSDIVSKNGTLSSITTASHQYPEKPLSDTASIITATGSTMGYRPSHLPPGVAASMHGLPGYHHNTLRQTSEYSSTPSTANGNTVPRTDGAQPQTPRAPVLTSTVTSSNIMRMGGIPVMVPAQSQAGSLV
ncbi:endothelial cell adhesion molecule a [Erpetoichthys calabaricus]|uniref:endothelial cell adhesion molecule a n=1 Tax=Erpetoichthys calabaricus TaxID=27687 RepID=UPI0022340E9F|nr:endothelial cell adhesion molecule a [Erpetoichthys calabaricus]